MHICVSKLTIIGSDNGLSPGRRQTIIWTNAGILIIGSLGTNFLNLNSKIVIQENAFESVVWKMAAILPWPQYVKDVNWTSNHKLYFFLSSWEKGAYIYLRENDTVNSTWCSLATKSNIRTVINDIKFPIIDAQGFAVLWFVPVT